MPENKNGIHGYQVSLMLQADVRGDCIARDGHECHVRRQHCSLSNAIGMTTKASCSAHRLSATAGQSLTGECDDREVNVQWGEQGSGTALLQVLPPHRGNVYDPLVSDRRIPMTTLTSAARETDIKVIVLRATGKRPRSIAAWTVK